MDSSGRSLLLTLTTLSCIFALCTANVLPNIGDVPNNIPIPPALSKICKGTDNPVVCARTILQFLKGPSFEPRQALLAEVNATLHHTKRAIGVIAGLMSNPSNSKSLNDCLTICKDQYGSILDSINDTYAQLSKNNVYGCKLSFSAVISYQQTCEDSFKESPGVNFSFARDSKLIFELAGNCLSLMDALGHK